VDSRSDFIETPVWQADYLFTIFLMTVFCYDTKIFTAFHLSRLPGNGRWLLWMGVSAIWNFLCWMLLKIWEAVSSASRHILAMNYSQCVKVSSSP
jgi:hypothetical protein